ncbi:ATP-dependent DNA helicase MER3 [Rhodosporidiobolus nylandii]
MSFPRSSFSSFPPTSQLSLPPSRQPQPAQQQRQHQQQEYSSGSSGTGRRRSAWDDDPLEDEVRAMLAASDPEGADEDDRAWTGDDRFPSSPTPSPSGGVGGGFQHPQLSFPSSSYAQRQQSQQGDRSLASYYAPGPPPPQPSFFSSSQRYAPPPPQQQRYTVTGSQQQQQQQQQYPLPSPSQPQPQQAASRSSGGLIRPMPVRPSPQVTQTSYTASRASYPQQRQLDEVDEDEEQYWGEEGEEGFEEALAGVAVEDQVGGLTEGVVAHGPSATSYQRFPGPASHPSQTQQSYQLPRPVAPGSSAQRVPPQQQQQQQDVQYLEDLDPFAPVRGGGVGKAKQGAVEKKGIKLRAVSELPDMFRSLWRFGVFNAVQSACFDTVYHSDKNVVIAAPTGAGKTVLFELAILRLFSSSPSSDTKVLYMAPTKSLCAERVQDWKRKFELSLGWTVQELTGDSDTGSSAWRDVAKARIVVTTPEKWDAMTRKWHDHGATLGQLRLFCIDEVHTVGADVRGAVLEVVVSRMKTLGTDTRFIAVSATVPNIEDVAEWLGPAEPAASGRAREKAEVFRFGEEFRPCKLQKFVYGYPKRGDNDFAFVNLLNLKLYDIIKQYSSGKPVLIFCSTRKSCSQAADALVKEYKAALSSSSSAYRQQTNLAWPRPARNGGGFKTADKHLATLLESGVAVHHAGMEMNDRKLVEKLFVEGGVSIVCSTSTLAVGVNLPARMVIIRGTKAFVDGQSKDYSDLEVQQMIGRAGRPQFDTVGVACIMTDKESQWRYENLVNDGNKLESFLHKSLIEHVNSEIALRTITSVSTALVWLRSTFLFVRIAKNAPYYAIANGASNPDERLEEICVQAIKELVDSGVVERVGEELASNGTMETHIMSKFYLSHPTFLSIKTLAPKSTMRSLLETLSKAQEFASFRWRAGEKPVLSKYNKSLKFPTEKVATTADRVMIIIQLVLSGVSSTELKGEGNVNPLLESRSIFSAALRIVKTMIEVAVQREDGTVKAALELLRSLNGHCWDSSSFVLRQLDGIGEKSYKARAALIEADIKSIEDVRQAEPDRLEIILSRKPPFGRKLINQAKQFPQFEVDIIASEETVLPQGVQVDATIEVRVKQTKPPVATEKGPIKLWCVIVSTTSDGEFVEFRRMRIEQLAQSPKQFDVSLVLVKPSQRLVHYLTLAPSAGSEVKTSYKPSTKASAFPIPTLGPSDEPEDVEDERWNPPAAAKVSSLFRKSTIDTPGSVKAAPLKVVAKLKSIKPDEEDDEEDPYYEPKRLPNGKFECGHTCREGMDKPPKRKPKSAAVKASTASTASKKAKGMARLDQVFKGSSEAQNKPLRLPGKPSSGVSLLRASGKTVATAKGSDTEDEDDADLPSLDKLVSSGKKPRRTLSASNRLFSPPPPRKPSYLDLDRSDPKVVPDEIDELLSSPSPPAPAAKPLRPLLKRFALAADADQNETPSSSTAAGNKRPRVSLREFASSSSIELDRELARPGSSGTLAAATPAAVEKAGQTRSLFRPGSSRSPTFSPPLADAVAPRDAPVTPSPPERVPQQVEQAQLEESTDMDELEMVAAASPAADKQENDDDEFDAWLAQNVVIV